MTGPKTSEKDPPASVRQAQLSAALFIGYVVVLFTLIDSRPLWLDEVIQLGGTSGGSWQDLVQHMLQNAGGAPLGYLGQHWLIAIAGSSIWTARLLSVIAGAGSLALLVVVGRQLGLSRSTIFLGASLWAICPLAVRYSLEGRPYMQALFFALAAVAAQLQLARTGKRRWALVLTACLSAAVYSQPFAVFAPLGFSLCSVWQSRRLKEAVLTLAAYAITGLCFLPWLLLATSQWREVIAHSPGGFAWTPSLVLLLLRECVGDGYPAAVPAILFAAAGTIAIAGRPFRDPGLPVVTAVLATVLLGLAADAKFNYFFAIRQVIYMVPFLLLLAAIGVTSLWAKPRYRAPVAVLTAVFVVAAIAKDYRHLTDRNEDWKRLSARLSETARGGCILIPLRDNLNMYTVFRPEIAHHVCDHSLASRRIILPLHPYSDPGAVRLAEETLTARGLTRLSSEQVGFAEVEVFTKPEALARPSP